MAQTEWVLLVEDVVSVAPALARWLRSWFRVRTERTTRGALRALSEMSDLRLVLADVTLGRDVRGGLDVLHASSEKHPCALRCSLAFSTATGTSKRDPRDSVLRFAPKSIEHLQPVVDLANAWPLTVEAIALRVAKASREWHLTPAQHRVLCWLVADAPIADYCARYGVVEETFQRHAKDMRLRVPGHPSRQRIITSLLRDAATSMESRVAGARLSP